MKKHTSLSKEKTAPSVDNTDVTLQLKEEQLDIAKKMIKTGEVNIHREVFQEEKTFTIPIEHEVLVIEKKTISPSSNKKQDTSPEIIKIPISEEKVDFTKRKVTLEDVSIYKEKIEEIEHIDTTIKKETPSINISGNPIVNDITDTHSF